jgi:hypothetical protein
MPAPRAGSAVHVPPTRAPDSVAAAGISGTTSGSRSDTAAVMWPCPRFASNVRAPLPKLSAFGRRLGVLAAVELGPAPRPDAIDLHLERETEEDPDKNDDAKDGDTLDGRVNDYGPDDVGDDQDLEAEQNAAAQVPA